MDQITVEDFNKAIMELKQSPIYVMSLGSKELFHSNFWAWIIRQKKYRSFILCFFKDFDLDEFKEVIRESKNRDLVIIDKSGNEYVIENKIKSFANIEQLRKYSKKKGVLTGLEKPSFNSFESEGWEFISYKKIASELEEIVSLDNSFEGQIIKEYCKVLRNIYIVISFAMNQRKNRLSYYSDEIKVLDDNEIRLMDVFRKLKAEHFIFSLEKLVEKYVNYQNENKDIIFVISRSFNHKNATIDFYFSTKNKDGKERRIGIQIEGNQFRYIIYDQSLNDVELYKTAIEFCWFDKEYDLNINRRVWGKITKMKSIYCKYGDNWLYQYYVLWDDDNGIITDLEDYKLIENNLIEALDKAKNIIENWE